MKNRTHLARLCFFKLFGYFYNSKLRGYVMNDVSLIKKIECNPNSTDVYPVTFDVGCNVDRDRVKAVYNLIKDKDLLANDRINLGDASFTIRAELRNISKISTILAQNDIGFYGIHVLYDKYLEMKEE